MVLEELEMEAELQLQVSVLSTKAWGSSGEADVQGVDGEATTGCCLWVWVLPHLGFPFCEMGEWCLYCRRATRLSLCW